MPTVQVSRKFFLNFSINASISGVAENSRKRGDTPPIIRIKGNNLGRIPSFSLDDAELLQVAERLVDRGWGDAGLLKLRRHH